MKIPTTAEDWELFTSPAPPGEAVIPRAALDGAARELTEALGRAADAVKAGADPYAAFDEHVEPVSEQDHVAEVGGADSEPREVAILYLMSLNATDMK